MKTNKTTQKFAYCIAFTSEGRNTSVKTIKMPIGLWKTRNINPQSIEKFAENYFKHTRLKGDVTFAVPEVLGQQVDMDNCSMLFNN